MAKKTGVVTIRCTDEEQKELMELSSKCGLARSEYLRRRIFFLPDTTCLALEELKDTEREIAGKINQVVRICNARHFITTEDYRELRDYLSRIDEKYAELIRDLKELTDRQFIESILKENSEG